MDEITRKANVAAVEIRRVEAVHFDESTKWECRRCGEKHKDYHSHVAHELCVECREKLFELARESLECPRCGSMLEKLILNTADPDRKPPLFACLSCALIIPSVRDVFGKPQDAKPKGESDVS